MAIPFTVQQFYEVFTHYNEAIWPIQILLYATALIALTLTFSEQRWAHRTIALILSGLWIWGGIVYHLIFFTRINAAAWLFGILFIFAAAVFIWFGAVKERLHFRPASNLRSILGLVLILYALVIYPLIGFFSGHHYPALPTFGVPCPLTIFTLGILLLTDPPAPLQVLIIPVFWTGIGSVAAIRFGVAQDIGMLVAAAVTLLFRIARPH
ncbi:MAG: DUF6064 family protein [Granulosicoccaceae bacterium]|jgi:hypothetical protein